MYLKIVNKYSKISIDPYISQGSDPDPVNVSPNEPWIQLDHIFQSNIRFHLFYSRASVGYRRNAQ